VGTGDFADRLGRRLVRETEEFLTAMLPQLITADTALHDGDAGPRKALWATTNPVTLFGAAATTTGWPNIDATFDWVAARFSDCAAFEIEVAAAETSGDLADLVAFERTTAAIGDPPGSYALRVTTIFRREVGAWRAVHRHGDPVPEGAARERMVMLCGGAAEASPGPA
jgi:ketosteroid isomerase-like protein